MERQVTRGSICFVALVAGALGAAGCLFQSDLGHKADAGREDSRAEDAPDDPGMTPDTSAPNDLDPEVPPDSDSDAALSPDVAVADDVDVDVASRDAASADTEADAPATLWRNLTPCVLPFTNPLHRLATAFDSTRGMLVTFAGMDNSTWPYKGWDMWEWRSDGTWTSRAACNGANGAPVWHADMHLAYDPDRGRFVAYGNLSNSGADLRQIWEWDPSSGLWADRTPDPLPAAWPAHNGWIIYDDSRRRMVVNDGTTTWEWDGGSGLWTDRHAAGAGLMREAAGTYDKDLGRIILFQPTFGGATELWEWDGSAGTWLDYTPEPLPGVWPTGTDAGSIVYDSLRKKIVLWRATPRELWEWDPTTNAFATRTPDPRPPAWPSSGDSPIFFDAARGVVLTAGAGWKLDTATATWTQLPVPPEQGWPTPRLAAALAPDPDRHVVTLFGGQGYSLGYVTLRDVWDWDGATRQWTNRTPAVLPSAWPAGTSYRPTYDSKRKRFIVMVDTDQVWDWEPVGGAWTPRTTDPPTPPAPSGDPSRGFSYDPVRDRVVLAGGDALSDEVWEWDPDGGTWTDRTPPTRPVGWPGPGVVSAIQYEPKGGLMTGFAQSSPGPGLDAWKWNGTAGVWSHSSIPGSHTFGGTWAFDPTGTAIILGYAGSPDVLTMAWTAASNEWSLVSPRHPPRSWPGAWPLAFDPARGRMLAVASATPSVSWSTLEVWEWLGPPPATPPDQIDCGVGHEAHDAASESAEAAVPDAPLIDAAGDSGAADAPGDGGADATPVLPMSGWSDRTTCANREQTVLPLREGAAVARDDERGVLVVFGGGPSAEPASSDLWEWDGRTSTWQVRGPCSTTAAAWPAGRRRAVMAFDSDRRKTVVFGGAKPARPDLWEWDGLAGAWTDRTPSPLPSAWPASGYGTGAYDPARRRLLFWEVDARQLWEWDGGTGSWRDRTPAPLPAAWPDLGELPAMVWLRDRMALVGADRDSGIVQIWEWRDDSGSFFNRAPYPLPLEWPWSFGEVHIASNPDGDGFVLTDLQSVWEWSCSAGKWLDRTPITLPPVWPSVQAGFAFAYDLASDRYLAIGGTPSPSSSSPASAIWGWAAASGDWTDLTPSSFPYPSLPSYQDPSLVTDTTRGRAFLYGSETASGSAPALWAWQADSGTWLPQTPPAGQEPPVPSGRISLVYDSGRDLFVGIDGQNRRVWDVDPVTAAWTDRTPATLPGAWPPPVFPAAWYDTRRGRVMVLNDDSYYDRAFWEWDGTTGAWSDLTASIPVAWPTDFDGYQFAWSSARGSLLVYGGTGYAGPCRDTFWEWDGSAGTWTDRTPWPRPTAWPGARCWGLLGEQPGTGTLLLVGDDATSGPWTLDPVSLTWTALPRSGPWPSIEPTLAVTPDPAGGGLLLFQGYNSRNWDPLGNGKTWEWFGP